MTSSNPNLSTDTIDLTSPLPPIDVEPFIFICSPSINVPDTCSRSKVALAPAETVNPVAPLLNPSIKLPTGAKELVKFPLVMIWVKI